MTERRKRSRVEGGKPRDIAFIPDPTLRRMVVDQHVDFAAQVVCYLCNEVLADLVRTPAWLPVAVIEYRLDPGVEQFLEWRKQHPHSDPLAERVERARLGVPGAVGEKVQPRLLGIARWHDRGQALQLACPHQHPTRPIAAHELQRLMQRAPGSPAVLLHH